MQVQGVIKDAMGIEVTTEKVEGSAIIVGQGRGLNSVSGSGGEGEGVFSQPPRLVQAMQGREV